MIRFVASFLSIVCLVLPAAAAVRPFPPGFRSQMIETNGTTLYVRVGGTGPAVVMLHGFGDTGDMWAPIAAKLMNDHTVIVPDLRGMGLSAHPDAGYTKKNEALDIAGILDAPEDRQGRPGHPRYRQHGRLRVRRAVPGARDAMGGDRRAVARARPLGGAAQQSTRPGISTSTGPMRSGWSRDASASISIASGTNCRPIPRRSTRPPAHHYAALYARPHAIHDAFEQFKAFPQDSIDNQALLQAGGKLTMPVLALGGEKSYGAGMAAELEFVASNVKGGQVPNSGHWVMEENPDATTGLVLDFLSKVANAGAKP